MGAGLAVTLAQLRPSSIYWRHEMAEISQLLGGVEHWDDNRPILLIDLIDGGVTLKAVLWCLSKSPPGPERDRIARGFSAECAERVLPVYEAVKPDDARPALAIAAARAAAETGDASGLKAAHCAALEASWPLNSEANRIRAGDPAAAKRLNRAATASEVAADCCSADAGDAAYSTPIRAATYLFGRDPGLPLGHAWDQETAWQRQRLRACLAEAGTPAR